MPIYEYRCDNGHIFEALQKFSDEPIAECQTCGAPAHRVLHPVAIHFKGSGFYTTDYGRGKKKSEVKGETGGDSKPSGDSKASGDAKPAAGSPSQAPKAAEA
jgi:putative FmdB family regulatory protein